MPFLHPSRTRIAGSLTAIVMLAGALAIGTGGANADVLSAPLVPVPGTNSSGGGAVSVTSTAGASQLQIDLNDASSSTTYTISVCTNTGAIYVCSADGSVTTDATGSVHDFVVTASTAQIDLILLVNSDDQSDVYQAETGSSPEITIPTALPASAS